MSFNSNTYNYNSHERTDLCNDIESKAKNHCLYTHN